MSGSPLHSTPKYAKKPICIVAGIGSGSGTGNATAREFARGGYRVALIARYPEPLKNLASEINSWPQGEAASFRIARYDKSEIQRAFTAIKAQWPGSEIRVAVFNSAHRVSKPFLELDQEDIDESIQTNIYGGFAFSQESILSFRENEINELGNRGALIFTSATSAWRGNPSYSAFAAGKHALRGLSQSLNKEFGKQNIHVSHAIIDGTIKNDITTARLGNPDWMKNPDSRIDAESIAKAYWYLAHQDRSAWTWELDLRPAHEKW